MGTRIAGLQVPSKRPGFDALDKNNDGKLSRAEYYAAMATRDVKTGGAKVGHAASGGSRP